MKNLIINIESKIDTAINAISKAISLHDDVLALANDYYNISINKIKEIESLIIKINKIENKYQKDNLEVWYYKYNEIQESISEIKLLQELYINL